MERRWSSAVLGVALVVCGAGLVRAEEKATSSDETTAAETAIEAEAQTPDGAARVTQRLADEFGVTTSQIDALRDQKMGYGEIHHALSLAKQMPGGLTTDNINSIMAMRQDHKGWGQIAHELDTNLGAVTRSGKATSTGTGASTTGGVTQAESPSQPGSTTHTGLGYGHGSVTNPEAEGLSSAGVGPGQRGLGHIGGGVGNGGGSSHGYGHGH